MSKLDNARRAVAELLRQKTGSDLPEWRTAFTTDGTDEPTGIIPVCSDPDHEAADGSVYSCCPELEIECGSGPFAEYLVALLNADRKGGAA